jgi:hypothetical protein
VRVRLAEPEALFGAHRAVVERKPQITHSGVLVVGDLAKGVALGNLRIDRDPDFRHVELGPGQLERVGGRELEVPFARRALALEVCNPHRAVDRGSADRAVALGE